VASSGTHDKMTFTLGLTGLLDRFEGRLFSATEVRHGKPAPDLFLHAAEAMGWEPSSCVVVEDSPYGVDAALAAGMQAIAYAGGVTLADRLARHGVTLITDMRDLPNAIAAQRGRRAGHYADLAQSKPAPQIPPT
jgi:beta-phosphoglucomutase-like phosphatase (HAD superfamily)